VGEALEIARKVDMSFAIWADKPWLHQEFKGEQQGRRDARIGREERARERHVMCTWKREFRTSGRL
jgi:hypothetical protein